MVENNKGQSFSKSFKVLSFASIQLNQEGEIDLQDIIPSYEDALEYLSSLKEFCDIKSFIKNEKNEIIQIIFKNKTYLPILKKKMEKDFQARLLKGINF